MQVANPQPTSSRSLAQESREPTPRKQRNTALPLWRYFYGVSNSVTIRDQAPRLKPITTALQALALEVSELRSSAQEHNPPRSNLRHLCRYLLLLKYLTVDAVIAAADRQITNKEVGESAASSHLICSEESDDIKAIDVPQFAVRLPPASLTNIHMQALKADPRIQDHTKRIFFLLTTDDKKHDISMPMFTKYLTQIIHAVCGPVLALGSRETPRESLAQR